MAKCVACGSNVHADCTGKVDTKVDKIDASGKVELAKNSDRQNCDCKDKSHHTCGK